MTAPLYYREVGCTHRNLIFLKLKQLNRQTQCSSQVDQFPEELNVYCTDSSAGECHYLGSTHQAHRVTYSALLCTTQLSSVWACAWRELKQASCAQTTGLKHFFHIYTNVFSILFQEKTGIWRLGYCLLNAWVIKSNKTMQWWEPGSVISVSYYYRRNCFISIPFKYQVPISKDKKGHRKYSCQ